MREQDKIDEAAFFLDEMTQREDRPVAYRYLTSALLSAARSVLQYAWEEAAAPDAKGRVTRPVGKAWYDNHMAACPLLWYFKGKRDANVHRQEPVKPIRTFTVCHEMRLLHDEDDMWPPVPVPSATMTNRYRFDDWSGPEDVPTLCRQYLDELRRVVADGQAKGFITS
jgi:hypothetical protein